MTKYSSDIKLSKKDRDLLYQLDLNARQSNSQIGRKIRMNKNTVNYRIKKLIEEGVITGFYTEINMYKLGLKVFRIFIRFQNITKKLEEEFLKSFANNQKVTWLISVEGAYDVMMGVIVKTNTEFFDFKEELLHKYSKYIQTIWYNIYVYMNQYKKTYLTDLKIRNEEFNVMGGEENANIDKIDDNILRMLSENAKIPLYSLASKVKISEKVASYRIKQLIKKEIIQSFRVMLDNNLLGYRWYKVHFWLKNISKDRKKELERFAETCPNIIYTNETIGGADFEPEFHVKNEDELRKIINIIREEFADMIKDYEVLHYFKIHKNLNYLPSYTFR